MVPGGDDRATPTARADETEHPHCSPRPARVLRSGPVPGPRPYERLVTAVLSWADPTTLTPHDYEQIALQLTGHARAVAADVRRHTDLLDDDTGPRALAEIILAEAQRRLAAPHKGTLRSVQNRARLVRALYERLDRLQAVPGNRTG
ncbi:DUF6415 family natural product biosynthesis protein [Streptomyces sp. TE33382]